MGVNSLPKTVTRQRRGCDLSPSAPESSTLTTRPPSARCELHASLPMPDCQLQHNVIPPAHRSTLAPPCGPHPSARIVSTQGTIEVYETSHDQWIVDWSWIGSRVTHCVVLRSSSIEQQCFMCGITHRSLQTYSCRYIEQEDAENKAKTPNNKILFIVYGLCN